MGELIDFGADTTWLVRSQESWTGYDSPIISGANNGTPRFVRLARQGVNQASDDLSMHVEPQYLQTNHTYGPRSMNDINRAWVCIMDDSSTPGQFDISIQFSRTVNSGDFVDCPRLSNLPSGGQTVSNEGGPMIYAIDKPFPENFLRGDAGDWSPDAELDDRLYSRINLVNNSGPSSIVTVCVLLFLGMGRAPNQEPIPSGSILSDPRYNG